MPGMTPERLSEIRARAEAATEGPWYVYGLTAEGNYGVGDRPDRFVDGDWYEVATESVEEDAEFIAAARTDVPDLVAEVERLAAAFEEIRSEYNGARKDRRADYAAHVAEVQRLTNDLAVTEAQAIDRDEAATTLAQQVEKVRAVVDDLDTARAEGRIQTYGQIQRALRRALDGEDRALDA